MNPSLFSRVLALSVSASKKAGSIIRQIIADGELGIVEKSSKTDLQTKADRAVQSCIMVSLRSAFPGLTVMGEEDLGHEEMTKIVAEKSETQKTGAILTSSDWLVVDEDFEALDMPLPDKLKSIKMDEITIWVDPLDGTKEFTEGRLDRVTVLIGIAVGYESVAGIIHQPYWTSSVGRTLYGVVGGGVSKGGGGGKLMSSLGDEQSLIVVTTCNHSSQLVMDVLDVLKPSQVIRVGGAGFKVLMVIDGLAHMYVYPSSGTHKWDMCAPEAVLRALGGSLTDCWGINYRYSADEESINARGIFASAFKHTEHLKYTDLLTSDLKERILKS